MIEIVSFSILYNFSSIAIQSILFNVLFIERNVLTECTCYTVLVMQLASSSSSGKIDLVRSKIGLGFTAVITVICSLTMSLGICTFFGLSITVSGR